jgi:hypothetical protein
MKAAYTRYGPPDVVEIDDLDKPVPKGQRSPDKSPRGVRQPTRLQKQ